MSRWGQRFLTAVVRPRVFMRSSSADQSPRENDLTLGPGAATGDLNTDGKGHNDISFPKDSS